MAMTFDATVKELAQASPSEFLVLVGAPPSGPVRLLNVDLSAVTTAADLVYGIGDPLQEILHVDSQAGPDADLPCNVLVYNALLYRRYRVPVHSVVLLLRPQAQHPNLNGSVRYAARPGPGHMDFGYEIVRLWERPVESLLAGSLGLLPLAPLCRLPENVPLEEGLGSVIRRVVERLQQEAPAEQVKRLFLATYLLTGLRVPRARADAIFQGVAIMRESDTYQAILDEGRLEDAKTVLLLQGNKRFGPPSDAVKAALDAIEDVGRVHQLLVQLLDATDWQQLLGVR
jgi:predicted transposase YdaD